ncbi:hypothetical protein T484DRAFT_3632272 [Baffinella frigidus]|nr:hypothetical protein T484DRAFT_3632272 [Cryptophyta sp. CCMP2293]
MPWRHMIFPVNEQRRKMDDDVRAMKKKANNDAVLAWCADSIPHTPLERLVDLLDKDGLLGSTIFPSTHQTSEMPHHEFIRRVSAERQIAREARLDAVLSNDLEPWSFTSSTAAAEDAPKTAHNEDQNEEFLDEEILQSNITRLSLIFQGDELNEILAPSAAQSPPPRRSVRGAAMVSVCAGAALQARPAHIVTDRSPASSCAHGTSFFATFCEDVDRVSA